MGKRMRRFLSIILSIALILGYIPGAGIASYAKTIPSVTQFEVPGEWEGQSEIDLLSTDLNGFKDVDGMTDLDWKVFEGAPTNGIVIYNFSETFASYAIFAGGEYKGCETDSLSHNKVFELSDQGISIYYTVGSSFVESYTVTIDGAAKSIPDVDTIQLVEAGTAMTTVTFTTKRGYHFLNFDDITVNGVTVSKKSDTEATVSGTPTADVEITVPDAAAAYFAVEELVPQETWDGNDTKLTTDMTPDFTNCALDEIKGWDDVPQSGLATVLYEMSGTKWKQAVFINGNYNGSYEAEVTLDNIYKVYSIRGGKFFYTISDGPSPAYNYDVTFKVVNGYWDDGTIEDKVVTLRGFNPDELKLSAKQIPEVGNKPGEGYMVGSWDVTPSTSTVITKDTTYIYTYEEKAPSSVTKAPTAKDMTYQGIYQALVTAGEATGGTLEYAIGTSAITAPTTGWGINIPMAVNAGTYHVWYRVNGGATHKDIDPEVVTVQIKKRNIIITGIEADDKDYDGTTDADLKFDDVVYDGKLDADKLMVTATGTFDNKDVTDAPKTVYISDIVLGGASVDNYQLAARHQTETTATIRKIKAEVEWGDITSFTYDGTEKKPTAEVSNKIGNDEVSVTVEGGQTEVGTYSATADALAGKDAGNYYLKDKVTQQFVISQAAAAIDVSIDGWAYGEYDEDINAPIVNGNVEGGKESFTYYIDADCEQETTPENSGAAEKGGVPVNVGAYTVKAEIDETKNYKAGAATCEFAVVEADKEGLTKAIEKAEQYYDMLSEDDDYEKVAKKLKEAIETAQDKADNPNISAKEIAEATSELQGAQTKAEEGKAAIDEANFEKVKEDAKKKADALANSDDSDACKSLIENAKKKIDATAYDHSKTPEENKAALTPVITELQKALDKQRTADKKAADDTSKYSNEWVDGKWYDEFGNVGYDGILSWKQDATGWWVEDTNGWYPQNKWQKIDGKWYFFTESGYMDYGEYRDGCWLGDDGAWVEEYSGGHWMSDGTGWWFEDNGWYPADQYLWIDGVKYWFNSNGYWE